MFIAINVYVTHGTVHWRMASVRPAHLVREGIYVWERRGEVQLDDPQPVTSRAVIAAALREMQAKLGER